ncbi:hypothetical protein AAVH_29599 [Aphelenchoides avenae]|nr:hypothetical protein AAVH_29599 [Aphelenchus avenae]
MPKISISADTVEEFEKIVREYYARMSKPKQGPAHAGRPEGGEKNPTRKGRVEKRKEAKAKKAAARAAAKQRDAVEKQADAAAQQLADTNIAAP